MRHELVAPRVARSDREGQADPNSRRDQGELGSAWPLTIRTPARAGVQPVTRALETFEFLPSQLLYWLRPSFLQHDVVAIALHLGVAEAARDAAGEATELRVRFRTYDREFWHVESLANGAPVTLAKAAMQAGLFAAELAYMLSGRFEADMANAKRTAGLR